MKGCKQVSDQTSLKNLLQKPGLLVSRLRAREEGGKRGGREEKERKEETKVPTGSNEPSVPTWRAVFTSVRVTSRVCFRTYTYALVPLRITAVVPV